MVDTGYYSALSSPIVFAGKTLRNRVIHASMTTAFSDQHKVTRRLIQYHANRARGGAALTVMEPLAMATHQAVQPKFRRSTTVISMA